MGAIVVVVVGEFPQDGCQVALVDHDQVVQTLGSNRPHDSFRDSVGVRRPTWGLHPDDPQGSSPDVEVPAVDSVPIATGGPLLLGRQQPCAGHHQITHDRPHRTLALASPVPIQPSRDGPVTSREVLGGLHHAYRRAA